MATLAVSGRADLTDAQWAVLPGRRGRQDWDRLRRGAGFVPVTGVQVLVAMAQPWAMPIRLVDGEGNFGSRGSDPPANFRYTEARITPAGRVALAAERGELAPVPIALINGNSYAEGLRPPFQPPAVPAARRRGRDPRGHHPA